VVFFRLTYGFRIRGDGGQLCIGSYLLEKFQQGARTIPSVLFYCIRPIHPAEIFTLISYTVYAEEILDKDNFQPSVFTHDDVEVDKASFSSSSHMLEFEH
jgi:hypothetical protein